MSSRDNTLRLPQRTESRIGATYPFIDRGETPLVCARSSPVTHIKINTSLQLTASRSSINSYDYGVLHIPYLDGFLLRHMSALEGTPLSSPGFNIRQSGVIKEYHGELLVHHVNQ